MDKLLSIEEAEHLAKVGARKWTMAQIPSYTSLSKQLADTMRENQMLRAGYTALSAKWPPMRMDIGIIIDSCIQSNKDSDIATKP